ncbi:hypothetical protein HID58_084915 [Brassica napus]|uniref:Uncharacterized protein n=1 Tax=Brassica napus TaxID=3708 RepID=A0ABQ7XL36_BRANA|nr:hypothetical protein HID58_084915 [Brassica napus]
MYANLCVSAVPRPKGDNPSLHGSSTSRNRLSPWVVDETTKVSLFVAPRGNEDGPLSLSVAVVEEVRLFVAVAVVDGVLCRWLSSTATELSLMALSDSLSLNAFKSGTS